MWFFNIMGWIPLKVVDSIILVDHERVIFIHFLGVIFYVYIYIHLFIIMSTDEILLQQLM